MGEHLAVIDPGMQSTLQDFGRYGFQRYGISAAGAIDSLSMQIANALVGNARDEAVIELTLSGGTYRVEADHCRLAMAGADMPVTIDGTAADCYRAHDLNAEASCPSASPAPACGLISRWPAACRRALARQPFDASPIASWRLRWTCPDGLATRCRCVGAAAQGDRSCCRERNRPVFERTRPRRAGSAG